MSTRKKIQVTPEKLRVLIENWDEMDRNQLARKLDIEPHTLGAWASQLRKEGIPLRRSVTKGSSVFAEVAAEYKKAKA